MQGETTTEPVFGLPALWVEENQKEEALALNPEENAPRNMAKPRTSNRQLSVDSGTMLRKVRMRIPG
jgi:hypothetical protein